MQKIIGMKVKIKLPTTKYVEFLVKESKATIGRSAKADITLQEESLSRIHAELEIINDEFYVTDLGSANGVFLDESRISQHNKTKFTTYQELLIGQLEVQVYADTEGEGKNRLDLNRDLKLENKQETTSVTAIRKNSQKKDPKKLKKKTPKEFNLSLVLVCLIVGLVIAYKFLYATKSNTLTDGSKGNNIQNEPMISQNQFLTLSKYEEEDKAKSCVDQATCQSLELNAELGEGISLVDKDVVIFFHPEFEKRIEKFKGYNKEDAAKLISIYLTLKSNLMIKLQQKEIGQIHVVLKNQDNAIINRSNSPHHRNFGGWPSKYSRCTKRFSVHSNKCTTVSASGN